MQQRVRQTGLAELIIVGVLLVSALGGLYALDLSRQKVGEERKAKELLPKIATAEKERDAAAQGRDTAVNANKTLTANLVTLGEERDACTKAVERLQRQGARMQTQRDLRKPVDDKKLSDIDVDKSELIAALGLPDRGGTCEQQLARSTALWKKVQEQRLRDFPPASGNAKPASEDVILKAPK